MRKALSSLLLAFILFGCAQQDTILAQTPMAEPSITPTVEPPIISAAQEPPGFYPGRRNGIVANGDYNFYLSRAQSKTVVVENRMAAIKSGQLEPGCIGKDVFTCMATMAQVMAVATDYQTGTDNIRANLDSDDPLIARDKIDVNGKTLSQGELSFSAFVTGLSKSRTLIRDDALNISVGLSSNKKIRRMIVFLRGDPLLAKTESEYDRTGIYEILSAVSMPKCTNINRLDVYKMIENHVKRHLKRTHDFEASMSDVSETGGEEGTAKFCGRKLWFYSFGGHAVSAVSLDNDTGIVGGSSLTIE